MNVCSQTPVVIVILVMVVMITMIMTMIGFPDRGSRSPNLGHCNLDSSRSTREVLTQRGPGQRGRLAKKSGSRIIIVTIIVTLTNGYQLIYIYKYI